MLVFVLGMAASFIAAKLSGCDQNLTACRRFTILIGNVTDSWSVTQSKKYYLLSSWFSESQFPSNPQHRLPSWGPCDTPQDLVSNTGFFGVCQLAHRRHVMGGLSEHGSFLVIHVRANLRPCISTYLGFPRDKEKVSFICSHQSECCLDLSVDTVT